MSHHPNAHILKPCRCLFVGFKKIWVNLSNPYKKNYWNKKCTLFSIYYFFHAYLYFTFPLKILLKYQQFISTWNLSKWLIWTWIKSYWGYLTFTFPCKNSLFRAKGEENTSCLIFSFFAFSILFQKHEARFRWIVFTVK